MSLKADPAHAPSARQKEHYEAIHEAYREYYDAQSTVYRERFIYEPLLEGLDLEGKEVADLACGSGATSEAILKRFPQARVTGFDISPKACADYEAAIGRPAFEADLTKPIESPRRFDAAIVIGGIHHCVVDLAGTLQNIAALLQPGGLLLMMEPNDEYMLGGVRRWWYRWDHYFDATTEHALSHPKLFALVEDTFDVVDVRYLGGPGYFLVFSSMVLRVPGPLKRMLAAPLMVADRLYNTLPGALPFPYFLARWRKREAA